MALLASCQENSKFKIELILYLTSSWIEYFYKTHTSFWHFCIGEGGWCNYLLYKNVRIYRLITALQRITTKNSPSKLEGAPEGRECVFAAKVILCNVVYYKVDSYIFIYLLSHSNYSRQYKNVEWRILFFSLKLNHKRVAKSNFEFWILNSATLATRCSSCSSCSNSYSTPTQKKLPTLWGRGVFIIS